jgi:hypothetical protein
MTVSMYKVSVPIFVQFLTAQSECIDKAVAHIEAKQLDPQLFSQHATLSRHVSVCAPSAAGEYSRRQVL